MKKISYKRHLAKSVTWRVIGTLDTMLLAWLITGDPMMGLQVGAAEVVTKMLLYYLHERLWIKVPFGVNSNGDSNKQRHLIKTVTWRFIGTIDTMLISWFVSGDPIVGLQIGIVEILTKMILYYLHERAWYQIDFGIRSRQRAKETEEKEANI